MIEFCFGGLRQPPTTARQGRKRGTRKALKIFGEVLCWQHFSRENTCRNATMSDVPPTRMNQQVFKLKLKAAEGGHRLLKKKADALKVRLFPARRSESMQEGRKRRGVMCSDGAVVKK